MQLFKTTSQPSRRASALFGWLGLLVVGSLGFAACGDDGNRLGSDPVASSSSGGNAGSMNPGGTGHAGGQAGAGTTSGGGHSAAGTAGDGGSRAGSGRGGGGATCDIGECIRANVCLERCGGKVVYMGCCPCAADTVEQTMCTSSGGQESGNQGGTDCAGTTCTATQSCVAYRTVGGGLFPVDDQGMCMAGKHAEGKLCQADFAYTCAELTGCGAPSAACRCAANTDCARTTTCRVPTASAWLDASADLVCELQVP